MMTRTGALIAAIGLTLLLGVGRGAAAPSCAGDCDGDGAVLIHELLRLVNINLGDAALSTCGAGDTNQNGELSVAEIITAVTQALNGCGAAAPCTAESCRPCGASDSRCQGAAGGFYCCTLSGSLFSQLDGANGCPSSGDYPNGCWSPPDGPCHSDAICRVGNSPTPTETLTPAVSATPSVSITPTRSITPTVTATPPATQTPPATGTATATPTVQTCDSAQTTACGAQCGTAQLGCCFNPTPAASGSPTPVVSCFDPTINCDGTDCPTGWYGFTACGNQGFYTDACQIVGTPAATATATPTGIPTVATTTATATSSAATSPTATSTSGAATATASGTGTPTATPAAETPTPTPTVTPTPPIPTGNCAPTTEITPGMVTFTNHCAVSLTLLANGSQLGTLAANGGQLSQATSSFVQAAPNVIMPYPNLTSEQCPAAYCDGWTALGGPPGTAQREGFMWEGSNLTYAAYCNPNLSGSGLSTCMLQDNCCGPNMVQDGTFGTTWEITPNGANALDYPDLSTNYGSGPMMPPQQCPAPPACQPSQTPTPAACNNCVSEAANIFFNVPIRWSSNMICSCTSAGTMVMCRQCLEASCQEAYQYPEDDKQCACASSAERGYLVEYCPEGTSLPPPPD